MVQGDRFDPYERLAWTPLRRGDLFNRDGIESTVLPDDGCPQARSSCTLSRSWLRRSWPYHAMTQHRTEAQKVVSGSRFGKPAEALLLVSGVAVVALVAWAVISGRFGSARESGGPRPGPGIAAAPVPGAPGLTLTTLGAVSNASGLALVRDSGRLWVATVDELDEWEGESPPPPLITSSDPVSGDAVRGHGAAGALGEVEALAATAEGFAYPWKSGEQAVNLRLPNGTDRPLVTPDVLARLEGAFAAIRAESRAERARIFWEFEGLDATKSGWELLATAVDRDARDTPASTFATFRLSFDNAVQLTRLSPPLRRRDGRLHRDYAAALCVLADDVAVIPAFLGSGVHLFGPDGLERRFLDLPVRRIEGVGYDEATQSLFLVRECVGEGKDCGPVAFGVPLWTWKGALVP